MSIATTENESTGTVLGLDGVSHGFGDTTVLTDIDLNMTRGEVLAIIGPSGTGKTTLLRLLALFRRPDRGRVILGGDDPWELSEQERLRVRRQIGMVFQHPNLFDANVTRNVAYGRHIRQGWIDRFRSQLARLNGEELPEPVSDVLEIVGMRDAAGQAAASLSGGEAQRVAFARALACDPAFLLLDEPTSDLDPRNTAMIEQAIDTVRARGLGVAIATHDMHQAEQIADRVEVLLDGQLLELGGADQIFSAPDDDRVRQFIEGELVY